MRSVSLSYVRKYYPDVKRVVDAKRGTKITVTAADCANGVGKAPNICAIAKAAMRHYDGAVISLSRAWLIKGDTAYRYDVPPHVTQELVVFDRAHQFDPGVYRLERVRKGNRLGEKKVSGKVVRRKAKAKVRAKHYTAGVRALQRHS